MPPALGVLLGVLLEMVSISRFLKSDAARYPSVMSLAMCSVNMSVDSAPAKAYLKRQSLPQPYSAFASFTWSAMSFSLLEAFRRCQEVEMEGLRLCPEPDPHIELLAAMA